MSHGPLRRAGITGKAPGRGGSFTASNDCPLVGPSVPRHPKVPCFLVGFLLHKTSKKHSFGCPGCPGSC